MKINRNRTSGLEIRWAQRADVNAVATTERATTMKDVGGQQNSVASPLPTGAVDRLGGGLPPARLEAELARAVASIEAVLAAPLPDDLKALTETYSRLGHASTSTEAALISALDALDARTGGGTAHPAAPFLAVQTRAMATLRRAGEAFAKLEPTFGKLVHGGGGWPNQPVSKREQAGDAEGRTLYRNTFKTGQALSGNERAAEYAGRVEKFNAAGGSFADIFALDAGSLDQLQHAVRYDYVMDRDGVTRIGTTTGEAKPGHSLLAEGGPDLRDQPIMLAGELWALRDSAGDLEVLLVANNSGHFKPAFDDLAHALPELAARGVPEEKIVLFGGPNNLPAMFKEIAEKHGLKGLEAKLPPSAAAFIEAWSAKDATGLGLRLS